MFGSHLFFAVVQFFQTLGIAFYLELTDLYAILLTTDPALFFIVLVTIGFLALTVDFGELLLPFLSGSLFPAALKKRGTTASARGVKNAGPPGAGPTEDHGPPSAMRVCGTRLVAEEIAREEVVELVEQQGVTESTIPPFSPSLGMNVESLVTPELDELILAPSNGSGGNQKDPIKPGSMISEEEQEDESQNEELLIKRAANYNYGHDALIVQQEPPAGVLPGAGSGSSTTSSEKAISPSSSPMSKNKKNYPGATTTSTGPAGLGQVVENDSRPGSAPSVEKNFPNKQAAQDQDTILTAQSRTASPIARLRGREAKISEEDRRSVVLSNMMRNNDEPTTTNNTTSSRQRALSDSGVVFNTTTGMPSGGENAQLHTVVASSSPTPSVELPGTSIIPTNNDSTSVFPSLTLDTRTSSTLSGLSSKNTKRVRLRTSEVVSSAPTGEDGTSTTTLSGFNTSSVVVGPGTGYHYHSTFQHPRERHHGTTQELSRSASGGAPGRGPAAALSFLDEKGRQNFGGGRQRNGVGGTTGARAPPSSGVAGLPSLASSSSLSIGDRIRILAEELEEEERREKLKPADPQQVRAKQLSKSSSTSPVVLSGRNTSSSNNKQQVTTIQGALDALSAHQNMMLADRTRSPGGTASTSSVHLGQKNYKREDYQQEESAHNSTSHSPASTSSPGGFSAASPVTVVGVPGRDHHGLDSDEDAEVLAAERGRISSSPDEAEELRLEPRPQSPIDRSSRFSLNFGREREVFYNSKAFTARELQHRARLYNNQLEQQGVQDNQLEIPAELLQRELSENYARRRVSSKLEINNPFFMHPGATPMSMDGRRSSRRLSVGNQSNTMNSRQPSEYIYGRYTKTYGDNVFYDHTPTLVEGQSMTFRTSGRPSVGGSYGGAVGPSNRFGGRLSDYEVYNAGRRSTTVFDNPRASTDQDSTPTPVVGPHHNAPFRRSRSSTNYSAIDAMRRAGTIWDQPDYTMEEARRHLHFGKNKSSPSTINEQPTSSSGEHHTTTNSGSFQGTSLSFGLPEVTSSAAKMVDQHGSKKVEDKMDTASRDPDSLFFRSGAASSIKGHDTADASPSSAPPGGGLRDSELLAEDSVGGNNYRQLFLNLPTGSTSRTKTGVAEEQGSSRPKNLHPVIVGEPKGELGVGQNRELHDEPEQVDHGAPNYNSLSPKSSRPSAAENVAPLNEEHSFDFLESGNNDSSSSTSSGEQLYPTLHKRSPKTTRSMPRHDTPDFLLARANTRPASLLQADRETRRAFHNRGVQPYARARAVPRARVKIRVASSSKTELEQKQLRMRELDK
eukprot:GSA120T00013940001.1